MSDDKRQITLSISQEVWDKLYKAGQSKELFVQRTAEQIAEDILYAWDANQNAKSQ